MTPLRILFISHAYAPSIGGIESMAKLLAGGFAEAGHSVKVVTQTPGQGPDRDPYEVIRRPGRRALWRLFSWCDVVVHNNISLRGLWPLLFHRRPWVIIHHTWIYHGTRRARLGPWLKMAVLPAARSICVSRALADSLPVRADIIPNCYDSSVFEAPRRSRRDREVLFVGRLVPDKGTDVLFQALDQLRDRGLRPRVTVVGSGPGENPLRTYAHEHALDEQVEFAGSRSSPEVADLMRRHRILVVPSRWQEPFGLVALEGVASGCFVLGSEGGGLAEAIGPGGDTFPNGDSHALASKLADVLEQRPQPPREAVRSHLADHHPERVLARYHSVLEALVLPRREAVV